MSVRRQPLKRNNIYVLNTMLALNAIQIIPVLIIYNPTNNRKIRHGPWSWMRPPETDETERTSRTGIHQHRELPAAPIRRSTGTETFQITSNT